MSGSITESGARARPRSEQSFKLQKPINTSTVVFFSGESSAAAAAMSDRQGPLKLQNRYAWNPDANREKNETVLLLLLLLPPLLCSTIFIINAACRPLEGTRRQVSPLLGDHRCLPSLQRPDWLETQVLLSLSFFFSMISRALLLVLLIGKNGVFFVVSICRYGKYQPLTEPAKW